MIEIIDLSKKYGNNAILENVSCSLENQRIYALVGVNGIGTSTLLNVPDSKEMFLNLTGNEYLKCIIQLYRQDVVKSDETLKKLSIAFKLDRSLNEYIANYSLGMKQKVYLMAAFLSGAGNLILDEPFNGLDPESVAMLKNLLSEYRDRGNLVLFSIHNLDLVANFCDDIVFIDKQRKVFQTENPKDFKQLEDVFFQKCV